MKRVITAHSQRHSHGKEEAGYWRGLTACTIGAIGRRMGLVSPTTFGGAAQIRRICIRPWRSKSQPHRTGSIPRIEQCVSLGRQIARPEEDHI